MPRRKVPLLFVFVALMLCACASHPLERQNLWNTSSRGGYVLLLAAASASDNESEPTLALPEGCAPNHSVSKQGRAEAQRLKRDMQSHAVAVGRVLTGSDCQCVITAGIAFGRAEPWSIIDDVDHDSAQLRRQKTAALREAISRWKSADNLALVTHRSNIRDALNVDALPGEVLVIEPMGDAGYRLLGRFPGN